MIDLEETMIFIAMIRAWFEQDAVAMLALLGDMSDAETDTLLSASEVYAHVSVLTSGHEQAAAWWSDLHRRLVDAVYGVV